MVANINVAFAAIDTIPPMVDLITNSESPQDHSAAIAMLTNTAAHVQKLLRANWPTLWPERMHALAQASVPQRTEILRALQPSGTAGTYGTGYMPLAPGRLAAEVGAHDWARAEAEWAKLPADAKYTGATLAELEADEDARRAQQAAEDRAYQLRLAADAAAVAEDDGEIRSFPQ
jgi:hypothetical protein